MHHLMELLGQERPIIPMAMVKHILVEVLEQENMIQLLYIIMDIYI